MPSRRIQKTQTYTTTNYLCTLLHNNNIEHIFVGTYRGFIVLLRDKQKDKMVNGLYRFER